MDRRGWSVFAAGLLLTLFGLYGMWAGWDHIQLERGWSQFIGGAAVVSGGVVTMALGRAINALKDIADLLEKNAVEAAPLATPARAALDRAGLREPAPAQSSTEPPVEVDRYFSGEAVYVMFSDGSVEVHSDGAAQRYPSLAALRADAGLHRR